MDADSVAGRLRPSGTIQRLLHDPYSAAAAKARHIQQADSQTNMSAALSTEPHLRPMRSHTKPMPCWNEEGGGRWRQL